MVGNSFWLAFLIMLEPFCGLWSELRYRSVTWQDEVTMLTSRLFLDTL